MKFLKKHFFVIAVLSTLIIYFFTRFYNILSLPIFTDEAIYIRWAQIAKDDAAWRFISLTDGKQPLFVWIAMILLQFIQEPLFAGRLVSIIAGFFSMIGIFLVTRELFHNKQLAIFTSFLYVIFPFALVYDRLALYDSLVAMFIIWGLYLQILLVRHLRLDLAMILGMVAGLGMLTKSSDNFILILLPFSLLLFDFKAKRLKYRLAKFVGLALVVVIIANAMYMILRLSPFFHVVTEKNHLFIYSTQEWLQHPFTYLFGNIKTLGGWLMTYMTIPFFALVIASFVIGKKFLREKGLLLLWFLVPFIALSLFGKLLYPRYILFMTIPLLVLGGFALFHLVQMVKKLWMKAAVIMVFLLMFVVNDFFIITDFAKAQIPQSDKGQFITSWPAGVGVPETITFLKEKTKNEKVFVGTGGTFGLMPYSLELYFYDNPNITIKGYWPVEDTPPAEVIAAAKKMPTYFVLYQTCASCPNAGIAPAQWQQHASVTLTPVLQMERIEKGSFYTLYQVKTK